MDAHDNIDYLQKKTTLFFDSLKKSGVDVTTKDKIEVIKRTREHYISHKEKYKLYVNSIDPFKFIAWSANFFISIKGDLTINKKAIVLKVAIEVMSSFLKCKIDEKLSKKLLLMALHDKIDDEKAIGKNGLYMAFRSASELCKKTHNNL
ncbi:hypothetical protein [Hydrogenimonas thermophila]|uniref:Uncharacterized protein n=1 Tax=Hydrogenimonas thermophila TaxID=223786 RepID=A0A1I5RR10_9BACT|nr:hypothetical protein [Hydrogenimonas thermophila]SFP60984.1 hypothetical protein SAMN05216234_12825 [Hydrogenimonas thermophila]